MEEVKENKISYFWFIEVKCCFTNDREEEVAYVSTANANLPFLKSYILTDSGIERMGKSLANSIKYIQTLEDVSLICFTLIFWHDYYPVFVDYEKEKSFKISECEYAKKWLQWAVEKFFFFVNNNSSLKE